MSCLPGVPLLGAGEVTLGRILAPLVCYYGIKLPYKAEPVLSGPHTTREHRSFPTAPMHLLLCSRGANPLPALGTARGDPKRSLEALFPPRESWKQREKASLWRGRALLALGYRGEEGMGSKGWEQRKGKGDRGEVGVGWGCLLSPPTLEKGQGHCPHCGSAGDPLEGTDRWCVPPTLGKLRCVGQGGGVGLAPISPPHESEAGRGLASPWTSSLCPWWSQI